MIGEIDSALDRISYGSYGYRKVLGEEAGLIRRYLEVAGGGLPRAESPLSLRVSILGKHSPQ